MWDKTQTMWQRERQGEKVASDGEYIELEMCMVENNESMLLGWCYY